MNIIERLRLPAGTSEYIEVSLLSYDSSPDLVTWLSELSATNTTLESGAPAPINDAATAVNRGTAAAPDWKIRVLVSGATAGTYGVWLKASGGLGASHVRFCGQVILY
jgi:hypothetical protein